MPITSKSALALALLALTFPAIAQDVSVSAEASVAVDPTSSAPPGEDGALTPDVTAQIARIIAAKNIPPVAVDFDVAIGTAIPSTVTLSTLPVEVTSVAPQLTGTLFFVLEDGRIVFVSLNTLTVVLVING